MAITGAHVLLYSSEADECRSVLGDVFGFRSVDAGGGWLLFALPPAELAVHPTEGAGESHHEFALMCDDVAATKASLEGKGVVFEGPPEDQGWGIACTMQLPGGVSVLLYEPRHPTAY